MLAIESTSEECEMKHGLLRMRSEREVRRNVHDRMDARCRAAQKEQAMESPLSMSCRLGSCIEAGSEVGTC
jgi:hypothetical protein